MKNKIVKDSFIAEIEEDIKNDNLKKVWDKYGVYLIATMAGILLITIFVEVYSYFKIKGNQELVNQYSQGLGFENSDNYVQAMLVYGQLANEDKFISELAMVEEVNLLIKQGNHKEAVKNMIAIIEDKNVSTQITDVARVLLVSVAFEDKNSEEIHKILAPVLDVKNSWADNAYELLAAAYLKEGKNAKAIEVFEKLSNESMNPSVKARASDVLSVLR